MRLLILSIVSLFFLTACGRVVDNRPKDATANSGSSLNVDDPGGLIAAAPPAFVSFQTLTNTTMSVLLNKECTDASINNIANYVASNGLAIAAAVKDPANPAQILLTTNKQSAISYSFTIFNLAGVNGTNITGVIQLSFTGLPDPVVAATFKDPLSIATSLPAQVYGNLYTAMNTAVDTISQAPKVIGLFSRNGIYADLSATDASVVAFKYRIDADAWSAEMPVSGNLQVSGLADGFHTLYIIGKHQNNYWQDTASAYTKSWVQDTTPPAGAQFDPVTLPAAITASQNVNIRVVGTEVAYYRYCLDNGAYTDCTNGIYKGAPLAVSTHIVIPGSIYSATLNPGPATLKVIGYDASGNAVSPAVAGGSYSFTVNTGVVEAVFDSLTLPSSINNGSGSASVAVLNSYGAVMYKGKIIDGTDCNSGTPWASLVATPLATPITRTGMSDAVPQKTVCAIGQSAGGGWQGGSDIAPAYITKYTWTIKTTAPITSLAWKNPITAPSATTQTTGYDIQVSSSGGGIWYKYAVVTGAGSPCASGAYSAQIDPVNDIILNPPTIATTGVSVYKVCVISGDAAGNWESTATAVSTPEWTVDLVAPANNPSFAATSAFARTFSTAAVTFTVDNSTAAGDTMFYRVQVAKTSAFAPADIIADSTIKSCVITSAPECPIQTGTRDFTTAVDSLASPSYYARVQAIDALGNARADWSTNSAEHYVVGRITGFIKDETNAAVAGATVSIYDANGTVLSALYPDQATDALGAFTFGAVAATKIRTAKTRYQVRVAKAGYYPAAKRSITVREEICNPPLVLCGTGSPIAANIGTLNVVSSGNATPQTVSGKIVDADDGAMLGYAKVSLIDYLGNVVGTFTRSAYWPAATCTQIAADANPPTVIPSSASNAGNTCGDFSFTNVSPGTYTIQVDGDTWYNQNANNQRYNQLNVESVAVANSAVVKGRVPVVRKLTGQDLKVVLTWGVANPADYDLHIVGTLPSGQNLNAASVPNSQAINNDSCDNTRFHVNWRAGAGVWQQQYSAKSRSYIQPDPYWNGLSPKRFPLDHSTTTALVQDVTTGYGPEAQNFISGYSDGTYWVSVVNYQQWSGGAAQKIVQQWDAAPATQIRVYDADGIAFEMNLAPPTVAPTNPYGAPAGICNSTTQWQQCEVWNAFKITVAGSGSAGRTYTPVGTFVNWPDSTGACSPGAGGGSTSCDANKCNLSGF